MAVNADGRYSLQIRYFLVGLFSLAAVELSMSQTLPNQFDPTARENTPNLAAVPAIRFLTTADFPPFNYRDPNTGELLGYNIELARDICASLDVACTIQAWPWEQSANALADGQGDALIAGLAMTAENSEKFDFSSVYMGLPARFVTTTDNAAAFSAERLAGETVSVRRGSAHEKFLQRYLPEVKLLPLDSEIEALSAVQQGQANAYFGDGMRASFWLNQAGDCCAFAGETYFRPDLFGAGLSVAFSADRDDMRQAIDWALLRLKQDGKLDELYLRWFPVGFY